MALTPDDAELLNGHLRGSGNFLYVTLEHLKRLEGEVISMQEIFKFEQTGLSANGAVLWNGCPFGSWGAIQPCSSNCSSKAAPPPRPAPSLSSSATLRLPSTRISMDRRRGPSSGARRAIASRPLSVLTSSVFLSMKPQQMASNVATVLPIG